jgi:hypothetical protein
VHAAIEFTHIHLAEVPDTVALLAARDELELCWLLSEASRCGVPHAAFREPDLDDALTAIALGPAAKKLCSKYPLALKEISHAPQATTPGSHPDSGNG